MKKMTQYLLLAVALASTCSQSNAMKHEDESDCKSSPQREYRKHNDFDGHFSPVLQAVEENDAATLRNLLFNCKANPDVIDDAGTPALLNAVMDQHPEIVHLLIQAGANVNYTGYDFTAVEPDYTSIGDDCEPEDYANVPPLVEAASLPSLEIVQMLIHSPKINLNAQINGNEMTAVMYAAREGEFHNVLALIEAGADVTIRYCGRDSRNGRIALMFAAESGDLDSVRALLATAPETVNMQDAHGRTALIFAAYNGHRNIVQTLINAGAIVDMPDLDGRTAVMCAAQHCHAATVQTLVENRANVNAQDNEGATALMIASELDDEEIENENRNHDRLTTVQVLISNGADALATDLPKKPSKNSYLATDWAEGYHRDDILPYLQAQLDEKKKETLGYAAAEWQECPSALINKTLNDMLVGDGNDVEDDSDNNSEDDSDSDAKDAE
jgi:ankyrin repeat protein